MFYVFVCLCLCEIEEKKLMWPEEFSFLFCVCVCICLCEAEKECGLRRVASKGTRADIDWHTLRILPRGIVRINPKKSILPLDIVKINPQKILLQRKAFLPEKKYLYEKTTQ